MTRFATLFFATLSIATASHAGVAVDTHEVIYRDLDLSTPAGAAALHRRVGRAIDALCADPYGPSPGVVIDQQCKADAWAGVRPQLETTIAAAQRDGSELALLIPHPNER
jgi:UrcA family protein